MEREVLIAFFNNAALLLVLSVIYEVAYFLPSKYSRLKPVFSGLLIALICTAVMIIPFTLQSGIIFDTRSILISVTALIFGPIPTAITVAVATIVRISIGGAGTLAGIATIMTSAFIGLAWHRWLYPKSTKWRWLNIFAMSISVHAIMLACMLLLPSPDNLNILRAISLPVMLIYPIATVLLSLLLIRQQTLRSTQDQLRQSEERFKLLFDKAPLGYQSLDVDGRFIDVNQQWCDLLGYSREEVLGKWFGDFLSSEKREVFRNSFPIFKAKGFIHREYEVLHKNGKTVFILFVGKIAYGFDGEFKQTHCILQDITDQKVAEAALIESERRGSVLLSHLPGLAYRCKYDRNWTMQLVSNGCYDLTGYLPECFINNRDISFNDIISPEYREQLRNEWERTLAKKQPFKYEYEITTATGARKWVLEMGQGIYDEQGDVEALEGIILDISDRKQIENNLRYINDHDGWTGLYNREYLEALLEKDAGKKDGVSRALISINLSTVQLLTANYGFHYTQNLIKKGAETLGEYCNHKRILFQTYENRFVFYLIDYKDKNELIDFCEAIAESLEALFVTDRIGGGIGVLEIEQEDKDFNADLLLRRLLIASERAITVFDKEFGTCFYNEEQEALVNREGDIRQALSSIVAGDSEDELFLQYQPIMNLKTNAICGFEALARLRTQKLGLVSPSEFIPIAEKTKLIIPIGEKVILQSFCFLNRLKVYGFETINISINISAIQLLRPDFSSRLFEMIDEKQVNPKDIALEITESVFASDYEDINCIISELNGAGMEIAIDDFGTGYSSLAREKELSVSCLKIDKYFMDKLMDFDIDKAITGDIISMAHRLGHCAVAEGVEHEKQLQYLRENGCDKIQGYLISKPLDEESAFEFLKNQEKICDCESNDSQHLRGVE